MGIDLTEKIECLERLKKEKEDVLAYHLSDNGKRVFYELRGRDDLTQDLYDKISIDFVTTISRISEVIGLLKGIKDNAID